MLSLSAGGLSHRNPLSTTPPPPPPHSHPQSSNLSKSPDPAPMGSDFDRQSPTKKRPFCLKCSKPARVCLCSRFESPPIDNSIGITILQHSREKHHPLNSVRVAVLGLKNHVVVPVTDIIHRAEFVVRPLDICDNGEVGSERSGFDEVSWSGAAGEGVGGVELSGSNGDMEFEMRSLSNGGNVDVAFRKVPSFVTDTEVNGAVSDQKCDLESILKYLGEKNVEVRNGFVQLPASQTHEHKEEVCSRPELPLENFDFDHDEDKKSSAEEKNCQTTDRKCHVTYNSDHLLISMDKAAKPVIGRALTSPIGKAVATNGFVVKKIQRKLLSEFLGFEELEEFETVIPPGSALLFPGKKSIGLGEVDFEVKHVIVLDGTWAKARRIYYENPWLQFLPLLRLDTDKASLYSEVRHQPKAGCLSTIESIVCALKGLGDDKEGLDNLLNVFESMIWDQRRCKDEKFSRISRSREV